MRGFLRYLCQRSVIFFANGLDVLVGKSAFSHASENHVHVYDFSDVRSRLIALILLAMP